jgi:hypothetical protein
MFIPDPDLDFYPTRIPDPGVKKAPDPGSATRELGEIFLIFKEKIASTITGKKNLQPF